MLPSDPAFSLLQTSGVAVTPSAVENTPAEVREAAERFEALFIQQMLKQVRSANDGDSLFGGSRMELAHDMFDAEVAKNMSRAGGLGLAEMLVRELGDQKPPVLDTRIDRSKVVPDASVPASQSTRAGVPVSADEQDAHGGMAPAAGRQPAAPSGPLFEDPASFVETLLPLARKAASELNVPAEAIVAQSALETGWGRHMLHTRDGQPAWNLFGIKADARWDGERVNSLTLEVRDGIARREVASFRAYGSAAEAVEDYVRFLAEQPRYAEVSGQRNPESFAAALQRAGYATDPDYAAKIERVARQLPVEAADGGIQEKTGAADA